MRSLKRLGAAFFATSMLCTINFANAKIFVGTSQVAESVNLIDKDLIESQNNELIAGKKKKKKKKKLNKQVVEARFKGQKLRFYSDQTDDIWKFLQTTRKYVDLEMKSWFLLFYKRRFLVVSEKKYLTT